MCCGFQRSRNAEQEEAEEEEELIILAGRQAHRKSPGESVVEFTGDPSAHARNTVLTFWWRGERL